MPGRLQCFIFTDEAKMTTDQEFNKLFWHCRRGMLELDVLLVPFLQEAYKDLPEDDQKRFAKLLESEDTDMFDWFMKKSEPKDFDLKRIISIILDRVQPK